MKSSNACDDLAVLENNTTSHVGAELELIHGHLGIGPVAAARRTLEVNPRSCVRRGAPGPGVRAAALGAVVTTEPVM